MKTNIDLTENRRFSEVHITINDIKSNKKSTPWEHGVDPDLPAKLKKNNHDYTYIFNNGSRLDFLNLIDDFSSSVTDIAVVDTWHDLNDSIFSTTSYFTDSTTTTNTTTTNWMKNNKKLYGLYKISEYDRGFPTGHKYEIINSRTKSTKKNTLVCKCYNCGKKIINYKDLRLSSRCDCIKSNNTRKNDLKYLDKYDENFHYYPHKRLPWHIWDIPFSWEELRMERHKKIVYYKNRQLRRREEPWQPNGRVPQEYDELFDSLDWREMLRGKIQSIMK